MLKLVALAVFLACVSSSVVPKPPASHGDVKHETPAVKPLHSDQLANQKPAEIKADIKHDDKLKSVPHHDVKSDDKAKMHHYQPKKVEQPQDHHAALKHHEVPVNVGHGDKAVHEAHKPSEKVENVKAKPHQGH